MIRILIKGIVGLFFVLGVVAAYVAWQSQARITRVWDVPEQTIQVSTDAAALERGRHLAVTRGCTECHAADLGGQVMSDDGFIGYVASANLTGGKGGIATMSDAQIARTLRHGLKRDGRSVMIMPALDYFPMNDEDVGALIAYLRTVSPVDRELGAARVGPGARVLMVLAEKVFLSAEMVDHQAARAPRPEAAVTPEYGKYVGAVCMGCHGTDYAGGLVNGPPGTPASANLTPAGALANWNEEQFLKALRTGVRPDGRQIETRAMPWNAFAQMDETETRAIWAFLKTLPPVASH
jgi:mono/diheme cytochrome c family protein